MNIKTHHLNQQEHLYITIYNFAHDDHFLLNTTRMHRRRLVINIGGQKFWSQILVGQKFLGNLFSDNKS